MTAKNRHGVRKFVPSPRMMRDHLADVLSARVTLGLILILLLIQLAVESKGGWKVVPEAYEMFGLSRDGVSGGRIWQLLSHGFLHAGWIHAGLNSAALLVVGVRLERIGGRALCGWVLVCGLLGGGALHLLFGGEDCLVGISGAVLAAMLCLTGVSPESRMWPIPVSGRSLGLGLLISSAILVLMDPRLDLGPLGQFGSQIDAWTGGYLYRAAHACHLGGALAGVVVARWLLRPRVSLEQLQNKRRRREGSQEPSS